MTTSFASTTSPMSLFSRTQRILSLAFPYLPADRLARRRWGNHWLSKGRPDHPPVVFSGSVKNAMRVVAMDRVAASLRLKSGQAIAEVRAMVPDIDVVPADQPADQAFLSALADWCDRYTPLVAIDGRAGLYLDISGCAHLHGGEKGLLDDLLSRLFHLGVEAHGAISSSSGLSFAMARFTSRATAEPQEAEAILSPLPLACLRLPAETIDHLARVGLKRVGDVLGAPRAPLARRFGSQLLLRLDQALGLEDEPLSPRLPVAELAAERRLATPIQDHEDILALTRQLAINLAVSFETRGEGGRLFALHLFRVDGKVVRLEAATSAPLKDPERIAKLYEERLQAVHDDLDAGFGFEIVRLCVLKSEPLLAVQADFSGASEHNGSLAVFADRVAARLGAECLVTPLLCDSHVPERAAGLRPVTDIASLRSCSAPSPFGPTAYLSSVRPLRLLRHPERIEAVAAQVPDGPPERFQWRRTLYRIKRAEGPERIAPEWWIDGEDAPTRDYFRVEDAIGYRFWLFRDGLYGHPVQHPQWYIHGVFA